MLGQQSLTWIRDTAITLGIHGAVSTRPDGSIKVVAEGEEAALLEFAEKIKTNGTIFSEVENFYAHWIDKEENLGEFYIVSS
jgi:acylphosphatase